MQMKKMTFKMLNGLRLITGIILLVLALLSSVNTAVNAAEKNDKIATGGASAKSVPDTGTDKSGNGAGSKTAGSNAWVLQAEQWELARSGESILSLPVLNQVMKAWLQDKKKKIEIQYPGGEEGEFWVQQLSDWLVALGIPSERMVTVPGSGADDMIKFDLIK